MTRVPVHGIHIAGGCGRHTWRPINARHRVVGIRRHKWPAAWIPVAHRRNGTHWVHGTRGGERGGNVVVVRGIVRRKRAVFRNI